MEVEGQTVKISARSTKEEEAKETGTDTDTKQARAALLRALAPLPASALACFAAADAATSLSQWHRVERSTQYSQRALRFPENADMHKVKAHLEDGVLKVVIPKTSEPQRKRETVKVT